MKSIKSNFSTELEGVKDDSIKRATTIPKGGNPLCCCLYVTNVIICGVRKASNIKGCRARKVTLVLIKVTLVLIKVTLVLMKSNFSTDKRVKSNFTTNKSNS